METTMTDATDPRTRELVELIEEMMNAIMDAFPIHAEEMAEILERCIKRDEVERRKKRNKRSPF